MLELRKLQGLTFYFPTMFLDLVPLGNASDKLYWISFAASYVLLLLFMVVSETLPTYSSRFA